MFEAFQQMQFNVKCMQPYAQLQIWRTGGFDFVLTLP
jgi:hypothetical protein